MFGLPRQEGLGNEQGEICILVPGFPEHVIERLAHVLPQRTAVRANYHTPAHRRVIGQLRMLHNVEIPLRIIFLAACNNIGHNIARSAPFIKYTIGGMWRKNAGGPERIRTASQEERPDISWRIRKWPDVCIIPGQSRWSRTNVVLSSRKAISSVVYLQPIGTLRIIIRTHCNGTTVAKFSPNRVPPWNDQHYTSGEAIASPCARRHSSPDCLWCCWPVVTPS